MRYGRRRTLAPFQKIRTTFPRAIGGNQGHGSGIGDFQESYRIAWGRHLRKKRDRTRNGIPSHVPEKIDRRDLLATSEKRNPICLQTRRIVFGDVRSPSRFGRETKRRGFVTGRL